MTHNVTLEGEFVNLRPLVIEDAATTFAWRQGERAKLLNKGADSVEQQSRWIASRPASEYNFIIELKDGRPVGMLALSGIDQGNRHAEPGRFLIGEQEAVQGIPAAVEAMKLLYEFTFERLGMLRVWGTIAADNHLMIKWQKYLGMKEEGRLRRHYFLNGEFQDALIMGLLAEEYRTVSLPRMNALIATSRQTGQSQ
jgi:diamine N-acetyltransferase